jgi:hypothetical protein
MSSGSKVNLPRPSRRRMAGSSPLRAISCTDLIDRPSSRATSGAPIRSGIGPVLDCGKASRKIL